MTVKNYTSSEARANLPRITNEVCDFGSIAVISVHGKPKVAMIDLELLEEYFENKAFGITEQELLRRSEGEFMGFEELKSSLNV